MRANLPQKSRKNFPRAYFSTHKPANLLVARASLETVRLEAELWLEKPRVFSRRAAPRWHACLQRHKLSTTSFVKMKTAIVAAALAAPTVAMTDKFAEWATKHGEHPRNNSAPHGLHSVPAVANRCAPLQLLTQLTFVSRSQARPTRAARSWCCAGEKRDARGCGFSDSCSD